MHTNKPRNSAVPGRLLFKGMSWFVLGALAWSFQVQADDDADDAIEEIIVTGSLIKRDNFDSASPLQVLEAAEILAEATPALGEIIYNQTFNYGSDAFSSHYSVTNPEGSRTGANFRGLGGGATLTLLDGKRVLDSNLNNLIPQIAIERIDILKDGASAIYGSDAVAGVINVIPKKAFQGAEIGAFFNTDHHRDHDEYVVNFIIGDTMDRGYFTLAMEHRERTGLAQTERANLLGRSVSSSGTGNPGSYNVPVRDAAGAITGSAQTADPGCGVAESPGGNGADQVGNVRNNISGRLSGAICRFEFGEFFNFVSPNKVLNTYLNYEYQINDQMVYSSDIIYSRQRAQSRGSPTNPGGRIRDINLILGGIMGDHPGNPYRAFYDRDGDGAVDAGGNELLFAADANADGVPDRDDAGAVILADQPFDSSSGIPFNEDVTIAALRLFGKLGTLPGNLDASGANIGYATYDINTYRMNHSILYNFDNGWDLTGTASLQQNVDLRFRKHQSYRAVLLGLQGMIGPEPGITDLADSYRYYNPFSTSALNCENRVCTDPGAWRNPNLGDYPNSQFVADSIDINAIRLLKTKLLTYDVLATGELHEGWAGSIDGAFGLEYRKTRLIWDARSDENQCNNWYDACSLDYGATDSVQSVFMEIALPLVDDDQFGYAEMQIAGRYSSYAGIGSSYDPKIAIRWQPLDWLAIRASFSTAFIAPSMSQRFTPKSSFLQSTNDLLFNDTEATYRTNVFEGNPDLEPEQAEITNFGFSVALADFCDNCDLNFGVDYSNFFFEDRITLLRGPRVVDADFSKFLEAYPQADLANVSRDDAVAWLNCCANPNIVRGGAPSYTIVQVNAYYLNAQVMEHTAIDVYADYTWHTDDYGSLRVGIEATHIDEFSYDLGGGVTGDAVGKQNLGIDVIPTLPEQRAIATVNWSRDNTNLLLRARWNKEVDAAWTATDIDALTYIDLTYTHRLDGLTGSGSNTVLEIGGRNITDQYPTPLGAFGASIELAIHDPRGRMFFVRAKHAF